ncbi:hypothetical protein TNCV_4838421 [Trichonephila clavipes]|nr:hypothetical protein TNCV_4838421 [Trichonephila clavipes]
MATHNSRILKDILTAVDIGMRSMELYIRLFRGAMCPDFILMEDNARSHRAPQVDEFLERMNSLISSIKSRCETSTFARGDHTLY